MDDRATSTGVRTSILGPYGAVGMRRVALLAVKAILIAVLLVRSTDGYCAAEERLIGATAANLRDEPSRSGRVMMQLPYGTICRIEGRSGAWIRIVLRDVPEIQGYVHETSLAKSATSVPEKDRETIRRFKSRLVAPDSYVDWARHKEDLLPDTPPALALDHMLKLQQESLERWLYWERNAVPIKYRIWALRLLGERSTRNGHVYDKTPEEVLNGSGIYTFPASVYNKVPDPDPWKYELHMPTPGTSFFSAPPGRLVVVHAVKESSAVEVRDSLMVDAAVAPLGGFMDERVLVVHLLKIYFESGQVFRIVRRGHALIWESQEPVPVAVCSMNGNDLRVARTRIQYDLGMGRIRLPGIDCKPSRLLVFFGLPSTINRIGKRGDAIVKMRAGEKKYATHVEVDFDKDGVADMIRSVVRSYAGALDPMGSFDIVYSFNVAGKWQSTLGQRVMIVP